MNELEALALLKQIENDEKGKSKNMHIQFDNLIADFLRLNGFSKLADAYQNPVTKFHYEVFYR